MFMNNANEDKPRRVAIYIRVSTQEQKIEGYGLEAQRKKLLDYVNNNTALNLYTQNEWIYCDTHTGSDFNRPELQNLLLAVREGKFDAVLVWKIDRLSRSLKHLLTIFEDFEKRQVSFISVQENIDFRGPIGKLIFQIFGAIAQFERELIKGRTQMGKIASAEMGNFTGNFIPYGYRKIKNKSAKGSRLELIKSEKKWVEQIFYWYIYDDMGFGQVAKKLNELKAPRGEGSTAKKKIGTWTEKMVKLIINNSLYRGEFIANRTDEAGATLPEDQWTIVKVPACISELTFQQAQIAKSERKGGKYTDYMLSGKLVDMTVSPNKKFSGCKRFKGGFSYRRKQFDDRYDKHHSVFEIPGKQIDEFVWGKIMEAMKDPEVFINHYLSREYAEPGKIARIEQNLENLREQKVNIETLKIGKIQNAYENGIYDEETLQRKMTEEELNVVQIEEKIQELEDDLSFMSSINIEVEKLKTASEQIKYRLEKLTTSQKKVICGLFVDRIEMFRRRDGKHWKINAEIFFRFNPNKFPSQKAEGRTEKVDTDASKETSEVENREIGATR